MVLANLTQTELSEEPRVSLLPDGSYGQINHYTGVTRSGGWFIQLGFNADVLSRLQEHINIDKTISETKIGQAGYGMVLDTGYIIAYPNETLRGKNVTEYEWYETVSTGSGFTWVSIDNTLYYAGY